MNTEMGKTVFTYYTPYRWNELQEDTLRLDKYLILDQFKLLFFNVLM